MENSKQRLSNLDYLRGLTAFSIMVYHYSLWSVGKFGAETFLGRIGLYGVSIFYVLSGLTLYYVYADKLTTTSSSIRDFFVKRIFRIYPLLILVTIATIVLQRGDVSLDRLLLNITGLFGIYQIDRYIAVGAWSIGNELVFYLFFPLFIVLAQLNRYLFWVVGLVITAVFLYFAFFLLAGQPVLSGPAWKLYINPFNQLILFFAGVLMGRSFKTTFLSQHVSLLLLVASVAAFILLPVQGDTIKLVTGVNRVFFSLLCCLICLSFYKIQFGFSGWIHRVLVVLGEASYSIYLLHPLVWGVLTFVHTHTHTHTHTFFSEISGEYLAVRILVACIATVVSAHFVYKFYEKRFVKMGERVLKKRKPGIA